MEYRQATIMDTQTILELSTELTKDTALGVPELVKLKRIISGPNSAMFVAEDGEKIIGFIAGVIHMNPFNSVIRASDLGLYVQSTARGGVAAKHLVMMFERWATENNASQVWLSQSTGHKVEATRDFYVRLGYTVAGVNTYKEI